ncbi:MAG: hypothetical protein E7544_03495 [Ruminococcaceae bacterium]|nr:hypothetical protein [Oscillospiraceae bacterium]
MKTKIKKKKLKGVRNPMIKGINRQVVEVKDTGNDCFEKILFFIKPEYVGLSEGKIRERAGLVTKIATSPPPTKLRKSRINEYLKAGALLLAGILTGLSIGLLFR